MIELKNIEPLCSSRNYKIFQHPLDKLSILKVRVDKPVRNHLIPRYAERRYGNLRQWNREANEYLAALNRNVPEIERLAQFKGFAVTTLGPALVVEKLTGPDGQLAPTLETERVAAIGNLHKSKELRDELMELLDELERGRIIVGDLTFDNVVRAEERGGKLAIIDGLGERVLIPLTLLSDWAFRQSIKRRRKRMALGFGLG
ncbi:YrbL family protein [Ruegeria arenilitoris]|uniref:YrbL family protein n=1 Tax=Ruegeria arenilitoris TaxID=1173585 RepID=UPI00147FB7F0|nr:YrbL family protein [Ruegeria arenilitoris]